MVKFVQWDASNSRYKEATLQDSTQPKNLLDNGEHAVCQRGFGPTTGITSGGFRTSDRWHTTIGALGTWTEEVKNLTAETSGPILYGHQRSLRLTCTTADASPAAGDFCLIEQGIELAQVAAPLGYGTSTARTTTVSFWVRSNLTGTYIVGFIDFSRNRLISASYTISVANTWEHKTVTFAGDTGGGVMTIGSGVMNLDFWLASGSTYSSGALATSWINSDQSRRASGNVNLAATVNNYWEFTGAQWEIGSGDTGYQHVSYDTELTRAMRYYQRYTQPPLRGVVNIGGSPTPRVGRMAMPLRVRMYSAPTATFSGTLNVYEGQQTGDVSTIINQFHDQDTVEFDFDVTNVSGAFTLGRPAILYQNGTGYLELSAEI